MEARMLTKETANAVSTAGALGLYRLLEPEVLADPYPLYHRLRTEAPVHWDPFLKVWVVTRYRDVVTVLTDRRFSAKRTPTPQDLRDLGLERLTPIAEVLVRQMLFLDAPAHTRIRSLASAAFTPRRVESLRGHIQEIVDGLLDVVAPAVGMDVVADLAAPLPGIVTAELLGVPRSDCHQLKAWSTDFAEVLGNFQHNPDGASRVLKSLNEMTQYFADKVREVRIHPREGLIGLLATAEVEGDRLSDEEVVANVIMMMVGGQETTTSLIGNGTMLLLRHPDLLEQLRQDASLLPSAVEEFLRYESPIQHTARLAAEDVELGGKLVRKRQAVIAVMGAANRDPERFTEPDRVDFRRHDNRHLAFGWAAHFCFGAPLARMEAHVAFSTMLRRFPHLHLATDRLAWQENLAYRGLKALPVSFGDHLEGARASASGQNRNVIQSAQPDV
jgi:pimeloyl-[acyl-carrier protein] synthase